MQRALLIIAKKPQAGRTKTRLSPPLSAVQAARLFESLLRDTLALARAVPDVERFILYTPPGQSDYFRQLAPDFKRLAQQGNSLGERLDNALTHCLKNGFEQVVIMNSDGPTLPVRYLTQAFAHLASNEAVFGPAEDGGYYLVGLTRPRPRLLREVQMSTPTVLQDTLALAREENVSVSLLPPWYDVDTIEDLRRMAGTLQESTNGTAPHTRRFLRKLDLD